MKVYMSKTKTYEEGNSQPLVVINLFKSYEGAEREAKREGAKHTFKGNAYNVFETENKVIEITKEFVFNS